MTDVRWRSLGWKCSLDGRRGVVGKTRSRQTRQADDHVAIGDKAASSQSRLRSPRSRSKKFKTRERRAYRASVDCHKLPRLSAQRW